MVDEKIEHLSHRSTIGRLWNRLAPRGRFRQHLKVTLAGTLGSQLLLILILPVLARIYGPDDFAVLALFTAITSPLAMNVALRYDLAILLPESEEEAVNVLGLSLLLGGILSVSLGSLIAATLVWFEITTSGQAPFIPLVLLASSLQLITSRWHNRQKNYSWPAWSAITNAGLMTAVQLLGAFLLPSWGSRWLIIGLLAGATTSALMVTLPALRQGWRYRNQISLSAMWQLARRYSDHSLFGTPQALLSQANVYLPRVFLGACFPDRVLGLFAMCNRALTTPFTTLNNSLRPVLYQRFCQTRHDPARSRRLILGIAGRTALLTLPILTFMGLWGEDLFRMMLGPQWTSAGVYLRLMLPGIAAIAIVGPLRLTFQALEKSAVLMWQDLVQLILSILALGLGAVMRNPAASILGYSLVTAVMYTGNLAMLIYYTSGTVETVPPQSLTEPSCQQAAA